MVFIVDKKRASNHLLDTLFVDMTILFCQFTFVSKYQLVVKGVY